MSQDYLAAADGENEDANPTSRSESDGVQGPWTDGAVTMDGGLLLQSHYSSVDPMTGDEVGIVWSSSDGSGSNSSSSAGGEGGPGTSVVCSSTPSPHLISLLMQSTQRPTNGSSSTSPPSSSTTTNSSTFSAGSSTSAVQFSISGAAQQQQQLLGGAQVAQLVWALDTLNYLPDRPWMEALVGRAGELLGGTTVSELAVMQPGQSVLELTQRQPGMSVSELADLVSGLAGLDHAPDEPFMLALTQRLLDSASELTQQSSETISELTQLQQQQQQYQQQYQGQRGAGDAGGLENDFAPGSLLQPPASATAAVSYIGGSAQLLQAAVAPTSRPHDSSAAAAVAAPAVARAVRTGSVIVLFCFFLALDKRTFQIKWF